MATSARAHFGLSRESLWEVALILVAIYIAHIFETDKIFPAESIPTIFIQVVLSFCCGAFVLFSESLKQAFSEASPHYASFNAMLVAVLAVMNPYGAYRFLGPDDLKIVLLFEAIIAYYVLVAILAKTVKDE